ncbi:ABC transporter permease [Telmatospirillum siberiense]|uniref:ABC transporter permease n=2 Tax=Telmatospirillum siberiense TaxID=382514 RepID=A0A2N3PV13_9PROT|nr:ABC transporter permease [Telmatospirillum siberiense]
MPAGLLPALRWPRRNPPITARTGRLVPALSILAVWQMLASGLNSPRLPSPLAVLEMLVAETLHGPLLHHLGVTLLRVALCFLLAMTAGSALGIAMGSSQRLNRWLDPWLQLFLNMPAMVVAILVYVWLGLGEPAAILAVTLSKLPNVMVILREGRRRHDRDLADMARAFRFPRKALLFDVLIPELAPFFLAAARSGLSLVWKIVLLVELLGRSDGIGFQLNVYFQMFDMTRILAYAASFMLAIQLVDVLLLSWVDRHVGRWQR